MYYLRHLAKRANLFCFSMCFWDFTLNQASILPKHLGLYSSGQFPLMAAALKVSQKISNM